MTELHYLHYIPTVEKAYSFPLDAPLIGGPTLPQ